MKTLKDIAKLAGVSVMTISRYFSAPEKLGKATRDKIKALVDEHNFSPNELAKSLITRKSYLIGVIVPDIRNPFFSQLYYKLETILEPLGYSLMLCNSKESAENEERYIRLLMSRQVEGIILVPIDVKNVELLIQRNINIVLVERIIDSIKVNTVSSDHYNGAYMAVEHLIQSGHRDIAILCGNTNLKPYKDRLRAYFDALEAAGIAIKKQLVCESKIDIESAELAFIDLIGREKDITAVFSCNNQMSIGAIRAIYKSNLTIPKDFEFAAFDGLPRTELLIPSIACVIQDIDKLAEKTVDLLLNQIANKEPYQEQIILPVTLKKSS